MPCLPNLALAVIRSSELPQNRTELSRRIRSKGLENQIGFRDIYPSFPEFDPRHHRVFPAERVGQIALRHPLLFPQVAQMIAKNTRKFAMGGRFHEINFRRPIFRFQNESKPAVILLAFAVVGSTLLAMETKIRVATWCRKFTFAGFLVASAAPSLLASEPDSQSSPKLSQDPIAAASAPLPDPTPKAVVLPPAVVLDTVEYVLPAEGRSIIVQKTEPPPGYLPPPVNPPPPPPPPGAPSEEFLARARAAAANRPEMRYLRFSATVYPVGPIETARKATLVRWTHERQTYQAWSSIDWNHFRGLGRFDLADGKTTYSCMMGIGDASRWRHRPGAPVPPDFQPGEIGFRVIEGDTANKDALADLETLHDLYRVDGQRLKLASEIREKAIRERQAWIEANPPQPQDIIVRHWKVPEQGGQKAKTSEGTEVEP
jgi:hypothetical protein